VTGSAAAGGGWALAERRLYLCTPDRPDLTEFLEACLGGGVDVVQLRDKELDDGTLVERARLARQVCAAHHVPLVLNDRPDLAVAAGADGVHVGQDDTPPDRARRVVGPDRLVGLSTHAAVELDAAVDGDAPLDYLSAGPVVETPTKPGRPGTGSGYVTRAVERSPWPVWVTGGVAPDTVPDLVRAGARHFVVVRWLTVAADPGRAARELRGAIDRAVDRAGVD
jgi:thiamine-phosphate pyrophosphorylase